LGQHRIYKIEGSCNFSTHQIYEYTNFRNIEYMNILILGTSNSLLKNGWTFGLKNILKDAEIENLSVGASPGIQFSTLLNCNFSKYDIVFFDSIPNDEEYFFKAKNYINYNNENILFELLSTISSQTQLIIMGFCNRWSLNEESIIYSTRKKIAKKIGAHFIDIRKILLLYQYIGLYDSLYETHPAHPLAKISYEIGEIIANEILKNTILKKETPINFTKNFQVNFPNIIGRSINLKNSLVDFNVAEYAEGEYVLLNNNLICLGFYINAHGTNCYIECLNNNKELMFTLDLRYRFNENKILKVFVPLKIESKVSYLKVSASVKNKENVLKPFMSGKEKEDKTLLQISEIVFWEKNDFKYYDGNNIFDDSESMYYSNNIKDFIIEKYRNIKTNISIFLKTYHSTYLLYDFFEKKLMHGQLKLSNKNICPVIFVKGKNVFYAFSGNNFLEIKINDCFQSKSIVVESKKEYINIILDGKYMSAERNGNIVVNRPTDREWERFFINKFD